MKLQRHGEVFQILYCCMRQSLALQEQLSYQNNQKNFSIIFVFVALFAFLSLKFPFVLKERCVGNFKVLFFLT